jgi:TonB family protein
MVPFSAAFDSRISRRFTPEFNRGTCLNFVFDCLSCRGWTSPAISSQMGIVSSGVMARNRIGGKDPKYPSDAKKAHIEGLVGLEATISDSGNVEDLCVSQGPAMLQQAAFDAVKTWRYKPFVLKGHPVEVETMIFIDFSLR